MSDMARECGKVLGPVRARRTDVSIAAHAMRSSLDSLTGHKASFYHLAVGCVAAMAAAAAVPRSSAVSVLCGVVALAAFVSSPQLASALVSLASNRRSADIRRRVAARERRKRQWIAAGTPNGELDSSSASPRFAPSATAAVLAHLDEHGYAVVAGVARPHEVETAKQLLWNFLSSAAGMRRDEPETWTNGRFVAVGDPTNGIVGGNGFGQSRFCWFLRTLPLVKRVFSQIWGTDDLISSFDGGNVFRPYRCGDDRRSKRTNGGWWHVDQGRRRTGRHAVQGLVSLYDATASTGGLCVVPGSHRAHGELLSYAAMNDADYVVVPEPAINPALRGARLVTCKAGDLVLWDSRTIHCNTPAPAPDSRATDEGARELLRAVGYVCMTPRRWASAEAVRLRRRAFAAGVGSSHWPHDFRPSAPLEWLEGLDEASVSLALRQAEERVRELVG